MKNLMGKVNDKMNANRKNGRKALKGFTLVEIIVVLVILAILAAAMIPALTGYIDKAKAKTAVAEARNVATAIQTLASESYAINGIDSATKTLKVIPTWDKINALADVSGTIKENSMKFNEKGKLTDFVYNASNGDEITYSGGVFTSKYEQAMGS